jgi:NAD(P)H dehydrogenase (quinone)
MKKILMLTAHPSTKGHTHKIAEAYKTTAEGKGHEVTLVDLYKSENQIPFLQYEDIKNYEKHPNVIRFQELITNTSEIVVIHPLWWGGAPAIMKNFFDQVFTAGFAFSWAGGHLNKLLKGRTAKVFITTGGPMWIYRLFVIPPFKAIWKYMTLEYCGVKVTDFQVCDYMAKPDREEHLARFNQKVQKSAQK